VRLDTPVLTVAQVTRHVKTLLESDELLQDLTVRGEIANFKRHSSGHLYFSLRDEEALLPCVMFAGAARFLGFSPGDGLRVLARGRISVYEPRGQYQLYVESLEYDGLGALFEAFERLRKRLQAEGLFEAARKRPLPPFPRTVAVVTSDKGAAIRDIINILGRRWPLARVLVFPATVQGAEAPASIVKSLRRAGAFPGVEVVIVGRGGGSLEDLWAFNSEEVVRAVAECPVPVVSAVGHETDVTLCDFAADLRAPTPSAAAELVVPDQREVLREARSVLQALCARLRHWVAQREEALSALRARRLSLALTRMLDRWTQECDELRSAVERGMRRRAEMCAAALATETARLNAVSPLAVLRRGYSVLRRAEDGVVVRSVAQVRAGDAAEAVVADGAIDITVVGTRRERGDAEPETA